MKSRRVKMRKIISLGIVLTIFIYLLPVGIQYINDNSKSSFMQDMLSVHASAEIKDDEMITVSVDGKAEQISLEDYITGVVAAEISPDFPVEAIKAQAVAARTYAVYKMRAGRSDTHPDADVCDDFHHCAAYTPLTEKAASWGDNSENYQNTILQAVNDTKGLIVTYENQPIIAVFSAASGDMTESAKDVWGSDIHYLVSVESKGGDACSKYKETITFTADEFRNIIQKAIPSADLTGKPETWFTNSERSSAGGIKTVKLGSVQVTGTDLRETLGLNSTNFTVSTSEDSISFHTIGYGHGVGLSQYGAKYLAEQGQTYDQILTHYYTGTQIKSLDEISE